MLALVKTAPGPGLELREVPEPAVGINDVLVKVRRTGICGTDLHIESWDPWAAKTIVPPLVVGHEFVGEITEVGSNVSDFSRGDLTPRQRNRSSRHLAAAQPWRLLRRLSRDSGYHAPTPTRPRLEPPPATRCDRMLQAEP